MNRRHCNVALFVPHAGCPHQCSFCNQHHIAGVANIPTKADIDRACEEAVHTMRVVPEQAEIAFFGGSFTAIPRETMLTLLKAAYAHVKSGTFGGIRISTRPDAIDDDVLSLLREYGVTTIELGAQSMCDKVLQKNRRGHTALQVEKAARLIKEYGFTLGLQMMTGLPGDDDDGAWETAHRLAALQPDFVRIYPTLVMEHTPLAVWYTNGEYQPQTVEEAVAVCARLLSFFEEERGIPVIRLGLHDDVQLREYCLAGPWHPAFRERCESRIWLWKMREALQPHKENAVRIAVHPTRVSQVVGQKRENIQALQVEGYAVTVTADDRLTEKDMRVEVIE